MQNDRPPGMQVDVGAELDASHRDSCFIDVRGLGHEQGVQRRPRSASRLGRYSVVCELASGGMATVNLAIADQLENIEARGSVRKQDLVALKVIHPHLAREESFVRMFMDEARIASRIAHVNVCSVFDYGVCDGQFYMAMDYLRGSTLRETLRRLNDQGTLSDDELSLFVAHVIAHACEGLHAAHELRDDQGELMSVVHRDVSPDNVFVTYDGHVSVIDFGIAHARERLQHTATGTLKGKFAYMAPEQVRDKHVDRRADIWALGVCLWEGLTRRRLFARKTQVDTLMSVLSLTIKPPSGLVAARSSALDAIALRALAREPERRYRTAREMGTDLMAFCRQSRVAIGPSEVARQMTLLFPEELARSEELERRVRQLREPTRIGNASPFVPVETELRATVAPSARNIASHGHVPAVISALVLAVIACLALVRRGEREERPPAKIAAPVMSPQHATRATPQSEGHVTGAAFTISGARARQEPEQHVPNATHGAADHALSHEHRESPRGPVQIAMRLPARAPEGVPTVVDISHAREPAHFDEGVPEVEGETGLSPAQPARAHGPEAHRSEERAISPSPTPELPQATRSASDEPRETRREPVLDAKPVFERIRTRGSLGPSVVSRMLGRAAPLLCTCYQRAARAAARDDHSVVSIAFSIDEAGLVRNGSASQHGLSGLSLCVVDVLKRVRSDQKPDVGVVNVDALVHFENPRVQARGFAREQNDGR